MDPQGQALLSLRRPAAQDEVNSILISSNSGKLKCTLFSKQFLDSLEFGGIKMCLRDACMRDELSSFIRSGIAGRGDMTQSYL